MIYKTTNQLDDHIQKEYFTNDKNKATLLLCGSDSFNLDKFPNLKIIYRNGVGIDNINLEQLKKRNIELKIASEKSRNILYNAVSNFTINLFMHAFYLCSRYERTENINILVIGLGNIGSLVYKKFLDMYNLDSYDILFNNKNKLIPKIKKADVITIHTPLNNSTKDLINENILSKMKENSIIINTARPEIINKNALIKYINKIQFVLDISKDHPYLKGIRNKIIWTPHIAGNCIEYNKSCYKDLMTIYKGMK